LINEFIPRAGAVTSAILFSFKRFGDPIMFSYQAWVDNDYVQRFLAMFATFSKLSICDEIASHRKDTTKQWTRTGVDV
jgi:hypothetical protein